MATKEGKEVPRRKAGTQHVEDTELELVSDSTRESLFVGLG